MSAEPVVPPTEKAYQNTDRELWRERPGDYYADSIFVTEGGGIGMNVGGFVVVMPIREWHKLAALPAPEPPRLTVASTSATVASGATALGGASLPAEHAPPDLPRVDADGCYTLPDGSCAGCPHCPHNSPTIGTSTKDDLDLALEAMSDAEVMAWASVIAAAVRDTTGWTSHIAWSIRRAVQGLKKRNTGGSRPALTGSRETIRDRDELWCRALTVLSVEQIQRVTAEFNAHRPDQGAKP